MSESPVIYWFRDDLRLKDLPGLVAASACGSPILACYVVDDETPNEWPVGRASRWWLQHSLEALSVDISRLGGALCVARGCPETVLAELATRSGVCEVFCSRQYEPGSAALEQRVARALEAVEVNFQAHGGTLLWHPEQVATGSGTPFKVFTPFWKACRALPEPARPTAPAELRFCKAPDGCGIALDDLFPADAMSGAGESLGDWWQPGEEGAEARLAQFLGEAIHRYAQERDYPAVQATSLLSPHLHFGEIAPARVFHAVRDAVLLAPEIEVQAEKFLSELGWREFSRHLLFHNPSLPEAPFRQEFERFPWCGSARSLQAWQQGQTGYPIVDAGMRELLATGYMQNRVRMVAASFLCKHLLIDWRAGERWFWEMLVDADLANNASNWQWVAGCGTDASPYFRIFNPTTQGKKFDSDGAYVRRWVPELSSLPDRYIHEPWEAPETVLEDCAIRLGQDYPRPLVEHKIAREAALQAHAHIKTA